LDDTYAGALEAFLDFVKYQVFPFVPMVDKIKLSGLLKIWFILLGGVIWASLTTSFNGLMGIVSLSLVFPLSVWSFIIYLKNTKTDKITKLISFIGFVLTLGVLTKNIFDIFFVYYYP
jgi:hypothetical protein